VHRVPMSRLTRESLANTGFGAKDVDRCRNMYALGLVYWLYDRPLDATIRYLNDYFGKEKHKPELADLNIKALRADSTSVAAEMFVEPLFGGAKPGTYRHQRQRSHCSGWLLLQKQKKLVQRLSNHARVGTCIIFAVEAVQRDLAEDEIVVICARSAHRSWVIWL
jgi:2-oxoglutarate ferredoxin oxidoreductase subunit alpha